VNRTGPRSHRAYRAGRVLTLLPKAARQRAQVFNRRFRPDGNLAAANDDVFGESGTRPDFKARSTISGPMPAQSPSVNSDARLSRLIVLLVIRNRLLLNRATISRTAPLEAEQQRTQSKRKAMSGIRLESLDVSLCAKGCDPAFLYTLAAHLKSRLQYAGRRIKATSSSMAGIIHSQKVEG